MITEQWRRIITVLMPYVSDLSESDTHYIEQKMFSMLYLMRGGYVDWERYPRQSFVKKDDEVTQVLESLLDHPLADIDNPVYVIFFFRCFKKVVKADFRTVLNAYEYLYCQAPCIQIWSPVEGYIIQACRSHDTIVGIVEKSDDPIYKLSAKKNSDHGCFMYRQGPIYEFFGSFGVEILADDKANTILEKLMRLISFDRWKNVDWSNIEKRVSLGRDHHAIVVTIENLLEKPLKGATSSQVYVAEKTPGIPLVRIDLTAPAVTDLLIWKYQRYGTVLFNVEEGYLIEIDLQSNITIGLMNRHE